MIALQHDTVLGSMSRILKFRASTDLALRVQSAAAAARVDEESILRAGAEGIVTRVADWIVPAEPEAFPPPVKVSDTTRRRLAEMDRVLGFTGGIGIAGIILDNLIRSMMAGDFSPVLECRHFDDPEQVEANLRCVADRWSSEDVLTRIRGRREGV